MSFDLGVWYPSKHLTDSEPGDMYVRLCESEVDIVEPHASIDAFYADLTAKHPEIDTIPDDRIDDNDYCPWSCALDRSPGHVIMPCVWSKADYVHSLVHQLAEHHGLAVYDPQSERITYPKAFAAAKVAKRPWWRPW